MSEKISVVINTLNEEKNIQRAIKSVSWADEVIVCDMNSTDNTKEIAQKMGAKVVLHQREDFVEPARNFAISKASNDWILILDADEEISNSLAKKLQNIANKMDQIDFVEIPRKNIIFGKFIQSSMWWPDYQIRFFKKGKVLWNDQIHSKPKVSGAGLKLAEKEEEAIVHYNYQSISQFLERMNRYTGIEADQLIKKGYKFDWRDLLKIPLNEFLSRFFANKGYKDGLHGLALSFLQAISFLAVYLKIWEKSGFREEKIDLHQFNFETKKAAESIDYWFKNERKGIFKKIYSVFKK